jgi:hypothetical protein
MFSLLHQLEDLPEFQEIDALFRFQRMLLEKRHDFLIQVIQGANSICHAFCMVPANHAAPKKLFECVKQLHIAFVLHHCEFGEHLESGGHLWMRINTDEEAPFSIDKSHHPLRLQPSRLWLNVKSLRVLHVLEPSLRIVPLSVGFLLLLESSEYRAAV